ncbi:MAG: VOC family protein [Novosphingobium sp.]
MFTHIFVGTNDVSQAHQFYNAVMTALGHAEGTMLPTGTRVIYMSPNGLFSVGAPANGEPATHANGGTIGLASAGPEVVDAAHAAGLANGGTCDGAPGPRDAFPGSYGAYLRDPDGNKLCLWHMPAA